MKKIILFLMLCFASLPAAASDKIKVLLTSYTPSDDYYSSRHLGAKGDKLKFGVAAVDFKKIPYNSSIKIFGNIWKCLDTGSAVVSRKAARIRGLPKNILVVDLFFNSQSAANRFFQNHDELTTAIIE